MCQQFTALKPHYLPCRGRGGDRVGRALVGAEPYPTNPEYSTTTVNPQNAQWKDGACSRERWDEKKSGQEAG